MSILNTAKNKNTWKTLGIVSFVFLVAYFVFSVRGNVNSYKNEINSLQHTVDSLNQVLQYRVDKDSILYYLSEQENQNKLIEQIKENFNNLKKSYYDKEDSNYWYLSTDSSIVVLAKFLSEKDSIKK